MPMLIGSLLRHYRRSTSTSQSLLAERIGVATNTVSRVERGEGLDGDTLAKILKWMMSDGQKETEDGD